MTKQITSVADDSPPLNLRRIVGFAGSFLLAMVAPLIFFSSGLWFKDFAESHPLRLALLASLVIVAVLLFIARIKFKYHYGLIEIGFALSSGWFLLETADTQTIAVNYASLIGTMYVLIRGISNCYDAIKEPSKKTGSHPAAGGKQLPNTDRAT